MFACLSLQNCQVVGSLGLRRRFLQSLCPRIHVVALREANQFRAWNQHSPPNTARLQFATKDHVVHRVERYREHRGCFLAGVEELLCHGFRPFRRDSSDCLRVSRSLRVASCRAISHSAASPMIANLIAKPVSRFCRTRLSASRCSRVMARGVTPQPSSSPRPLLPCGGPNISVGPNARVAREFSRLASRGARPHQTRKAPSECRFGKADLWLSLCVSWHPICIAMIFMMSREI